MSVTGPAVHLVPANYELSPLTLLASQTLSPVPGDPEARASILQLLLCFPTVLGLQMFGTTLSSYGSDHRLGKGPESLTEVTGHRVGDEPIPTSAPVSPQHPAVRTQV